jgi:hypothetical protein
MTNTDQKSGSAEAPTVSINDNLPSGNPPLKVVLTVFGCLVLIVLVLTFHSALGF